MKKLVTSLLLLAVLMSGTGLLEAKDNKKGTPPGLKKKGGVPPGLQKKGGLPPGQAKKRGQPVESPAGDVKDALPETEANQKKAPTPKVERDEIKTIERAPKSGDRKPEKKEPRTDSAQTSEQDQDATEPLRPTRTVSREMRHKQIRLQSTIQSINTYSKNPSSRSAIMRRMTRKQRMSEDLIKSQLAIYPQFELGDIYAANFIAKKSRKPLKTIVAQRKAGLSWGELASEHRVDLPQLLENSNEIEQAARQATPRRS